MLAAGGGGAPAWVLRSDDVAATMDIDFVSDLAWLSPSTIIISSILSCSRNLTSYYQSSAGVLTPVSPNALRYGDQGLFQEAAATNILQKSQAFDDAYWALSNATITADQISAPDGTATADLITATAPSTSRVRKTSIVVTTVPWTLSAYVKRGNGNFAYLNLYDGSDHRTYFNLNTGAVATNAAGNTAVIEALASGWYRISVSRTMGTVGAIVDIGHSNADNNQAAALNQTTYFWGAQLELGSSPSSYIATDASSVTRPLEIITFSNLSWFDGSEDSIYAQWIAKNVNNATVWAFDATNDKVLKETTGMSASIADATVSNTVSAGVTVAAAARMSANDFAITMDSGPEATDTSETAPGTLVASRLGLDLAGANPLNGYIKRVAVF